jgi:D-hexose-6-phosphate mutarotase
MGMKYYDESKATVVPPATTVPPAFIYNGIPDTLDIADAARPFATAEEDSKRESQILTMKQDGFTDVVIWNPYINKSKTLADFGM